MNDQQDAATTVHWFTGMHGAGMYWFLHSNDEDWDDADAQVMDGLCDGVFEYCPEEQEVRLRYRG